MNKYEILFILENEQTDENKIKFIDKMSDVVTKSGGNVVLVDKWGTKRLAYEINHKKEGYYFLMNVECNADVPEEITRLVNIGEGAIRCMIVRKEKFDEVKAKYVKPVEAKVEAVEAVEAKVETIVETKVEAVETVEAKVEAPVSEVTESKE